LLTAASLSLAALAPIVAEAGDFPYARFAPYRVPSIRPKVESYLSRFSFPFPGESIAEHTSADTSPAANESAGTTGRESKNTCLSKEYLATGAVLFQDTCTNEWAINSSAAAAQKPVRQGCLRKEVSGDRVVVFRDTCTDEWAMNTSREAAPAAR
jgi:hypothetical protein